MYGSTYAVLTQWPSVVWTGVNGVPSTVQCQGLETTVCEGQGLGLFMEDMENLRGETQDMQERGIRDGGMRTTHERVSTRLFFC